MGNNLWMDIVTLSDTTDHPSLGAWWVVCFTLRIIEGVVAFANQLSEAVKENQEKIVCDDS